MVKTGVEGRGITGISSLFVQEKNEKSVILKINDTTNLFIFVLDITFLLQHYL